MERLRLSLFELNSIVSEIISMSLPDSYWVEAELSEAREGYGGHCYLELIQKELENIPSEKVKRLTEEHLADIVNGQRDFRF